MFVQQNCDFTCITSYGFSVLRLYLESSQYNSAEVVRLLIQLGSEPSFWQRERPLREYRKVIPAECIMEMIEGGAEINYVDAEN